MNNEIYHCKLIFNLNNRLFINALAGITDQLASKRLSNHNNPLIWIATHTVWARYNAAMLLGKPGNNPYDGMFENFKPYDSLMKFQSIKQVKEEWEKATDLLTQGLASVNENYLATDAPFKNPTGDSTIGGTIAFLAQHESYDIGQMGLLKKYLTKEGMSYN